MEHGLDGSTPIKKGKKISGDPRDPCRSAFIFVRYALNKTMRRLLYAITILLVGLLVFKAADWLFPLPQAKLAPRSATIVYDRDGNMLRAFLAPDEMWRMPVETSAISEDLKQAVLQFEDRYFFWHPGVNPAAILRAAMANVRAGKIVQGGSTITMQVARMMAPKERTIGNKLVEMFRALQLEWRYSKDEILAFYLNMAPYGGNLVGIKAAAYFYFGKPPSQISLGEAALLAVVPNSPNRFRPDLNPAAAKAKRKQLLRIMLERGQISDLCYHEAEAEPLPTRRRRLPFKAPHLAVDLKHQFAGQTDLHTTIDGDIQEIARSTLGSHLLPLRAQGIGNGAVVVIDNREQSVRALVGSADFFDHRNQGQVNGATSPRSPGSTLKPFIYALGFEHGLISPKSLLNDVPVEYAGYEPVNFDGAYNGAVSAEDALIRSLNVPAVNLYARLGNRGAYSFLKRAGVNSLPHEKDHYGLSLILGGCEISLLQLTNLYAGLANGGRFRPAKILRAGSSAFGQQLLSEATCYLLTEILSQVRRPELPAVWDATFHLPKVAWKTGTSYGHRDAWSVGYTPQFTVGVWVGNFDGKGVPALVGAEVAAPILFAIFDALAKRTLDRWFIQPEEIVTRQVCAVSGMLPADFCATLASEMSVPGRSPVRTCTVHRLVTLDVQSGKRLCSHCRVGRETISRVFEVWPPEIATWRMRNGHALQPVADHLPSCTRIAAGQRPLITSPSANTEYKIRPNVDPRFQQIRLDASVSNKTQTIYWFLNQRLIFSGDPHQEVFLTPERGKHALICMDDEGRSSEIELVIH